MVRFVATLPLVAALLIGCGLAQAEPRPSVPPAPAAPAGWVSIGQVGSGGAEGFVGARFVVSGRPLAIDVTCAGTGTLVVTIEPGSAAPLTTAGSDAVAFPCSTGADVAPMRHELGTRFGAGGLKFAGGVVPGAGAIGPTAFDISVEEPAP
jgi:hypothetical protein